VASVRKSALVAYSAGQMFDLVYDVTAYPQFLPWCHRAQVISETAEQICGRIEIARLGIHLERLMITTRFIMIRTSP